MPVFSLPPHTHTHTHNACIPVGATCVRRVLMRGSSRSCLHTINDRTTSSTHETTDCYLDSVGGIRVTPTCVHACMHALQACAHHQLPGQQVRVASVAAWAPSPFSRGRAEPVIVEPFLLPCCKEPVQIVTFCEALTGDALML